MGASVLKADALFFLRLALPDFAVRVPFDSIAVFLIYFINIQFFVEGNFHKESEYSKEP